MKKLYIAAILLFLIFAIVDLVGRESKIDSCLDFGGRWNYEEKSCERGEEDPLK